MSWKSTCRGVARSLMPHVGLRKALLLLLVVFVSVAGCQRDNQIRDDEVKTFDKLLEVGLGFEEDPYVQAESLHLLETLGNEALAKRARPLLKADNPMVRVAALRVLLSIEHDQAERETMIRFNEGPPAEKLAVFQAVLDFGTKDFERKVIWKAIRPGQPEELRRVAFRDGLVPRVRDAMEAGNDTFVRKLFLPNVNRYVQDVDPQLGGPILELMIELGEGERARQVVKQFSDRSASVEERLAAARILIESGSKQAVGSYEAILGDASPKESDDDRLALPEKQIDKRLVRAATLGMVATGHTDYVRAAKAYLKNAEPADYVHVLEALAKNPAEGAKLALKTAMLDVRPMVRNRAIELYGEREDATVDAFLNILRNQDFEHGMKITRQRIAQVVGRRFPEEWVSRLKRQLTSDEGILPALKLVRHVYRETNQTKILEMIRKDLIRIADSGANERAPLAAYLLVQLPDALSDPKISEVLEQTSHPMPRYAYLGRIVEHDPAAHVDFLLDNFYATGQAPEYFVIRLVSGAGLWIAEGGVPPESGPGESGEADAQSAS